MRYASLVLAAAAVLLLANGPASAQTGMRGQVQDLVFPTSDLQFRVEDVRDGTERLQVEETEKEVKIALSGDVLFDFDKADIRTDAEPVLKDVGELLKQFPESKVRIEGHTDAKGSVNYNLRLSERRAASVKTWLVTNAGLETRRVATRGFGKSRPVAPNTHPDGSDNPEGRQKNRRVEVTVQK